MPPRDLSRALQEIRILVNEEEDGLRLDHWLQLKAPWRSRSDMQRRIRDGKVLVENRPLRKSTRVRTGWSIVLLIDADEAAESESAARIPLRFLYEDEELLALDKPAGVIMHPVGQNVGNTLLNALHRHYDAAGSPTRPMVVHRIDKETSGLVVFAKTMETRKELGRAFEERRVQKSYLALVEGRPPEASGVIDLPIAPDEESEIRVKMCCRPDGKASKTRYEQLRDLGRFSLLRLEPQSGRQHQIRVHLEAIGCPILGDWLYGTPPPVEAALLFDDPDDPRAPLLERLALHSESLVFPHPGRGEAMSLSAPCPEDFLALLGSGSHPVDRKNPAD